MITGINKSKTLAKHISCKCKCKFDRRKCNSNQWWNTDKCRCECKKRHVCEKDYIWNLTTFSCENRKCLASIMNNSEITCDEIIQSYDEEAKTIRTNFNKKKATRKTQNFYILFAFLLITLVLLKAVSIYCYLKITVTYCQVKQKHSLLFHSTNNELKQVLY